MFYDGWKSGDWAAAAAVASVFVNLALVAVAAYQLSQARKTREDEARPVVYVGSEVTRKNALRVVVENIGKTMAYNVRLAFDPPLQTSITHSGVVPELLTRLSEPIPNLAPGQRIVCIWDSLDSATPPEVERYDVRTYCEERPRRRVFRTVTPKHEESYVLDRGHYRGRNIEPDQGGEIAQELRAMRQFVETQVRMQNWPAK